MIELYTGEFCASPSPLEMGLNWCSFSCQYCFANLGNPERTADAPAIMRLLADLPNRKTMVAQLLKAGFATVVSNRVDAFAQSNYKIAVPILETMAALGLKVVFQSKGGQGIDRIIDLFSPSVWYISISFMDDKRRAKIEPGAPTIDSRFDLIARLLAAGNSVVVGMNPLVKEWLPPVHRDRLLVKLKELGVWGVWTEPLHLNRKQMANIPDSGIEAMGLSVVKRALVHHPPDVLAYYHESRRAVREHGLHVFSMGQFEPSRFFEPWRTVYPKTFAIQQDFVNWCHANKKAGDVVTCDDWLAVMGQNLPTGTFANMYQYFNQSKTKFAAKIPKDMSYQDVLRIIWQEPHARRSPQDILCFARATRGGAPVCDDTGLPELAFNPEGQMEPFMEVV